MRKLLAIEMPEFPKWEKQEEEAWKKAINEEDFSVGQLNDTALDFIIRSADLTGIFQSKENSDPNLTEGLILQGLALIFGEYESNDSGPIFVITYKIDNGNYEEVYNKVVSELTSLYEQWLTSTLIGKVED